MPCGACRMCVRGGSDCSQFMALPLQREDGLQLWEHSDDISSSNSSEILRSRKHVGPYCPAH